MKSVNRQEYLDFFSALTKKFGEDVVDAEEMDGTPNTTIFRIVMKDVHGDKTVVGQYVCQKTKILEGERVKVYKAESHLIDEDALKLTKYEYSKVIQENWGGQWEDVDHHPTNSQYVPFDRQLFKENWQAYKENSGAQGLRVIKRKERRY